MRIGIDAREIQNGVFTGIGRSLESFLGYFSQLDDGDECTLFSSKEVPLDFNRRIKNVVIKEKITFFWDQLKLPIALKNEGIDVFYSPYYKVPLLASCRVVSSILDLMYLLFDEYRRNLSLGAKLYYMTFGRCFAQKAQKIITCSEYSKKDIIKYYKVPEKKIRVIHLSVNKIYNSEKDEIKIRQIKQKYAIHKEYILFVGNFKPHKNVQSLILAFKKVVDRDKAVDLQLVLVAPLEHSYQQLRNLIERLSLQDKVIFTGKITDLLELKCLYNAAVAFVIPTLYEGFNLPPLEAMSCATAVISSQATSSPEVIGAAGIIVDPEDTDKLSEEISAVANNEQLRNELISKGLKRAKLFSIEMMSDKILQVLKYAYEESK